MEKTKKEMIERIIASEYHDVDTWEKVEIAVAEKRPRSTITNEYVVEYMLKNYSDADVKSMYDDIAWLEDNHWSENFRSRQNAN